MILLWLLFIIFISITLLYRREQKKYKGFDDLPGPLSLPVFGTGLSFGFHVLDHFKNINKFHDDYGPNVRIWPTWMEPQLFTNDADTIALITNNIKYIDKSRIYRHFEYWLGTGLLTSTGAKWHSRRKLLTPAFHFKILEQFIDLFAIESDILLKKLENMDESVIDIYPLLNLCALDVICRTAMGTEMNAQSGKKCSYIDAVKAFLELAHSRQFSLWKMYDCLYKFSTDFKQITGIVKTLHEFTNKVIQKRRSEFVNGDGVKLDDYGRRRKIAFIDLLIEGGKSGSILTDEDIREEVDTFMFEGHDTITSALSFTIYEIANNLQVQRKIFEEWEQEFGESEEITLNKLGHLKYLDAVIKEGLRMYPSVPFIDREIKEDIKLGRYSIPAKTSFVINIFSLHRQEKYFINPNKFDPDRFLNLETNRHPFSYIPFSAGPRNCIGQKYAVLEMKMIVGKIVKNFQLFPAPDHELKLYNDGILKSLTGIRLRIVKRQAIKTVPQA